MCLFKHLYCREEKDMFLALQEALRKADCSGELIGLGVCRRSTCTRQAKLETTLPLPGAVFRIEGKGMVPSNNPAVLNP
jgi:hypothetical protein